MLARMIDIVFCLKRRPELSAGIELLEDERRFVDLEQSVIWFTGHELVHG
jgi:hypothetical protein